LALSSAAPASLSVSTALEQARAAVAQLREAVDSACDPRRPEASGVISAVQVTSIERLLRAVESIKLTAVAAVDSRRLSDAEGSTGTAAWLAVATRSDGATAARQVELARALTTPTHTRDGLPGQRTSTDQNSGAVRESLARGDISAAHAQVIVDALDRLPGPAADAAERLRLEGHLVQRARLIAPAKLRREARKLLALLDRPAALVDAEHDRALRQEEAAALAKTRLTMHDNGDGTTTGRFTVPTFAAGVLRKCVQQMTTPRRRQRESTEAQTDWAHEQGLAMVALLEHLPTDHLHGKVAATVVVTVQHDHLRTGIGAAGLDIGADLSISEARRIACGAGVLPAVLNGTSLPLDVGRTNRFFTQTQRTALATFYDECAVAGCGRPFAWSELHHRHAWSTGGRTDLHEAVPLCWFHHRRVHDPEFRHEFRPDPGHPARQQVHLVRRQ